MYDTSGHGWSDATWPGETRQRGRPRSAIHDPWREPRQMAMPSALPAGPTIFVAVAAILLAFLLGRATGGGGGGTDEAAASNAPVVSTTTSTTQAPIVHTVQDNESLSAIASQYGVSVNEIAVANGITDVNNVREGEQIVIPAPTPPTVATTPPKKNKN